MAKESGGADQFANIAAINVTESAANTLTFKKLETAISLFEKIAWIIHRIEYFWTPNIAVFNADQDKLHFGLSATNSFAAPALDNPAVLDFEKITRVDVSATSAGFDKQPIVKDLATLPGGGLIVPPNPLYGWALGEGLVSAATINMRLYYSNLRLTADQYWELVEARRIISA
jgi:hypothetical protein